MNGFGKDETAPVARARAAALAELRRAPVAAPWTRQAARVVGASVILCALAAGVAVAASLVTFAQAPFLAALLVVAVLGGVGAVAPRGRNLAVVVALAGAPIAMVMIAWARGAGVPSSTPAWVCSVSHVGLDLIPLAFALAALRQSAWTWPRALAAGLGAGAVGAFLGELACHQGARHVLVHHVGAWLFVALACVAISRALPSRSFAP
ncbi:MAG TPA: DUF1109 domain-containing protein [Polyangia bacterium]|jgi:hypothetical protein|nr:DUF1109 domain-containing protein [Polyangia bacterium]